MIASDKILYAIIGGLVLFVSIFVMVFPYIRFLSNTWKQRYDEVMANFQGAALLAYYNQFNKSITPDTASAEFIKMYNTTFGRHLYVWPLIGLVGLAVLEMGALIYAGIHKITGVTLFFATPPNIPKIALAAIAGAYLWVTNDAIWRVRRRDVNPPDIYIACMRLVIAIPMGYAFATFASVALGAGLAFALGAFPIDTISHYLRALAGKALGQTDGGDQSDELTALGGVNKQLAERFSDEGVDTIAELAYFDPILLAMRTSLSFDFVLDLTSQAITYTRLKEKITVLYPLGLAGAYEISRFVDAYDGKESREGGTQALAIKNLPIISTALGMQQDAVERLFRTIATDSYTLFICALWDGTT